MGNESRQGALPHGLYQVAYGGCGFLTMISTNQFHITFEFSLDRGPGSCKFNVSSYSRTLQAYLNVSPI